MEGQRPGVEHTGTWGRVAEVLGVGGESYVTEELVSHAEELALSPQSRGEPLRGHREKSTQVSCCEETGLR